MIVGVAVVSKKGETKIKKTILENRQINRVSLSHMVAVTSTTKEENQIIPSVPKAW